MHERFLAACVLLTCCLRSAAQLLGTEAEFPVVLTPTRLKQSLQDVPASVTIITSSMMEQFQVMSVADALRLVPGMHVTQASGNDYRVNYHGTNILTPRRMNVLIDGVSVYQPAFARVDWASLPVVMEDIDRIEVTRGPNSATYGPNSMLGIVNIITKHPSDVAPLAMSFRLGSGGATLGTARVGFNFGTTSARITLDKEHDEGFDDVSRIGGGHDGTDLNRINLRSMTRLEDELSLDLNAGYVNGIRQIPFVEQFQVTSPDQRLEGLYLSGTLTKGLAGR